ncbi:MAG: hypothetical protein ACQEP1_03105 [Nanobdellota archaeon]
MGLDGQVQGALAYLKNKDAGGSYFCSLSHDRRINSPEPAPKEIGSSVLVLRTALARDGHSSTRKRVVDHIRSNMNDDFSVHFFEDKSLLPPDADTTSFTLSTLIESGDLDKEDLSDIAWKIADNKDNGRINVYFHPEQYSRKNRFDEVALSNICHFLYMNGFENEADEQLKEITRFFKEGRFSKGSRYYFSPDAAVYFASNLTSFFSSESEFNRLLRGINGRRLGRTDHPLDMAMRITSAYRLGLKDKVDSKRLSDLQNPDGSFPADSIYKYGSKDVYFGSRVITTAFSVEALVNAKR